jgi:hypothetical protein
MNQNQNIFPTNEGIVPFRLRWDWPWEAGVVDAIREPVAADAFEELRKREKKYAGTDVHSYNAINAKWAPPRFVSLFAAIRPNETAFSRWVCCGDDRSFEVKQERGLWHDMLGRLATANGADAREHPLIYPLPIRAPLEHWVYPPNALILDTTEGLAAAMPWSRACQYLKLNYSPGY